MRAKKRQNFLLSKCERSYTIYMMKSVWSNQQVGPQKHAARARGQHIELKTSPTNSFPPMKLKMSCEMVFCALVGRSPKTKS